MTMNAYEQRRAARVDRMRARADRLERVTAARRARDRRLLDCMNGTPLLIGHHSEKRHRRDLARLDDHLRADVADTREAEALRRRADAAETSTAVSSDDPDAISKLKTKLSEHERQHAALLEVNKRLRNGESLESASRLLDWWPDPLGRLEIWRSMGHKTIPLGNSSAEGRRLKARIAELEAKASAPTKLPEELPGGVRLVEEDNRVRIFFPGKPSEELRASLKGRGFKWAPTVGAWQRMASPGAWYDARAVLRASS